MNGGVSLAVWMGGVTLELDRTRTAKGAYAQLLDLTETDARIDVIAGASAGGINGAVLALAIARGSTVDEIRQLWMTDGDIDLLLRDPLQREAPSILQGDEQLLRRLHEAMAAIGRSPTPAAASARSAPLYLSITGTILKGELATYPDSFGAMIPDVTHRAIFRFRRPGVPQQGDAWPDNFATADSGPDLPAAQLALAARSSASFPGAFEPSFVPIDGTPDALHPDMKGIADFKSERWVIDGGVLVNTPIQQALDAIKALPADRPVRRVLGYVVPNPAASNPLPDGMPSPANVVLDALSRLPRVQSVGRELAEIEENNRNVRQRRAARDHALTELDPVALQLAAKLLFPAYVRTRRSAATEEIVQALVVATGSRATPTAEQVDDLGKRLNALPAAPWLPAVEEVESFEEVPIEPWGWGFAPVENAANVALELLQRTVGGGRREARPDEFDELRLRMHQALRNLRQIERESAAYWRAGAKRVFQADGSVEELASGWASFGDRLGAVAMEIASVVTDTRREFEWSIVTDDPTGRSLDMLLSFDPSSPARTLRRLLALDVVQRVSGADLAGIEQEVELVLMSADAANSFGRPAQAEEKLAGLQLGHFGAFYKSSWRANDWMWGRLDGADRLVRMLLDPRRVRRRVRADGPTAIAAEIAVLACHSDTLGVTDWLTAKWVAGELAAAVRSELHLLAIGPDDPPLTALAVCYAAIRLRVQVEILVEEIPAVAAAVVVDRAARAAVDSLGSQWERSLPIERPLTVEQVVAAFERCPIGKEAIADEVGSDRFTKVASKTGAVAGSVLGGALPRVTVLKPVLSMIRGLLLTLYLLGRGVTESSKTGSFLVALTLAVGGALVAVYAVGAQVPGLLLLLGSTILIAGVLLAILRTTLAQLALAVLIFFGAAAGYYGVRQWHGRPSWIDPLAAVLAVALMTFGATALGWSAGKRVGTPGASQ